MGVREAIACLTGADLKALGLVSIPEFDERLPGQPSFRIVDKNEPFTIHWGFRFIEDGQVASTRQDVSTGQRYALVCREQCGGVVVLNGVRITFHSESLHQSCKVIDVLVGTERLRTSDNREALRFVKEKCSRWGSFVEQSILCPAVITMGQEKSARDDGIRRRVAQVTNAPCGGQVIDLDLDAELKGEKFSEQSSNTAGTTDSAPATNPRIGLPPWENGVFLHCSPELLEPPTENDRPVLVQMKIINRDTGKSSGTVVTQEQRDKFRRHVAYWLKLIDHRANDLNTLQHFVSGLEMVVSLRVGASAGYTDKEERFQWLENAFRALKNQVEQGTPRRRDSTVALESVSGLEIVSVRCAYP